MANRLAKAISAVGSKRKSNFARSGKTGNKKGSLDKLSNQEIYNLLEGCSKIEEEDIDMKLRTPIVTGKQDAMTTDSVGGGVCLISESPYRILKLGSSGNLSEVEKLYKTSPQKLNITDTKGRSLLHVAAAKGKTPILDFALSHGLDINSLDKGGNTALHAAAEAGSKDAVAFLLSKNADSSILNNNKAAALHVAIECNQVDVVAAMCSWTAVNVNIEGENGAPPLHTCAYLDRDECAKILLQSGAKPCKQCHIGLYPAHVAAQNGSSKTLKVLIDYSEKMGYNRKNILNYLNQEQNTPLHSAVNGGDLQAVEMCLAAGSDITETTVDKSTAVHLAAANGSIQILQLMTDKNKDAVLSCMHSKDISGRQPLHIAALYDRADLVQFFLKEGANSNATDDEMLTPLLLGATKKAWNAVDLLIKTKPDLKKKDLNGRNVLHLIIMNGGSLDHLSLCLCNKVLADLLNTPDDNGCIPLHYACREGMLGTIKSMLNMGAFLNAKNKEKQSPLHFAAKYGRFNTCKRLLDSAGPTSINDTDGEGQTALHGASANGHTRVVALLLQRGATPFRNLRGCTPIHLASAAGYTQTMKLLLGIHSHLINAANKKGDTPLHLAARDGHSNAVTMLLTLGADIVRNTDDLLFIDVAIQNEHKDVCVAVASHDRWHEAMQCKSVLYGCPLAGFIKFMPSVCQMILDRCRSTSDHDRNSKKFHYIYDFRYLQCEKIYDKETKKEQQEKEKEKIALGTETREIHKYVPLFALNMMVRYNRVECLSHPVCTAFLRMKWLGYGIWIHLMNLLVYLIFLGSLTAFITSTHDFIVLDGSAKLNTSGVDENVTAQDGRDQDQGFSEHVALTAKQQWLMVVVLAFCILNVLKEIIQMIQQKVSYFQDITNLWEWILYITTGVFIGPFVVGINSATQWQCAAIAVFLAWFNLLIFLQRFDFFGIYVVMFLEILKTLLQVLMVFSILIVAFALTFYILFFHVEGVVGHHNTWLSMVTTIVMMTGTIEYVDNWLEPYANGDLMYQTLTFIMLIVFILLVPILLVNLLIGLAVGDIESIQRDAILKRIAMQVQYNTELEDKLPQFIMRRVDKDQWEIYPNCSRYHVIRIWTRLTRTRGVSNNIDVDMGDEIRCNDNSEMEHQTYMYSELHRQRIKLKQISNDLSKQYDLLRLIVQKMEIKTEQENQDDDHASDDVRSTHIGTIKGIGWSSKVLRHDLLKQSTIISKWTKSIDGHK